MKSEEGKRLKLFMEREGIDQPTLAKETERNQSDISRYISGKLKIPLDLIKYLHMKYRLNYTWMFHGTGTMKVKEVEQRKLMNDVTDILATLSMIMANQEAIRDDINKIARDFYAFKNNV